MSQTIATPETKPPPSWWMGGMRELARLVFSRNRDPARPRSAAPRGEGRPFHEALDPIASVAEPHDLSGRVLPWRLERSLARDLFGVTGLAVGGLSVAAAILTLIVLPLTLRIGLPPVPPAVTRPSYPDRKADQAPAVLDPTQSGAPSQVAAPPPAQTAAPPSISNPPQAQTPPPSRDRILVVCVGGIRELSCSPDAVFVPCGVPPEDIARKQCEKFSERRRSVTSGGRCGTTVIEFNCLAR